MGVLRLTSKKTMPLLLEALRRLSFTQTELAQATNTSIGRVNKVIAWLKEKDIILKQTGRYVLTKPNTLADLIADQQIIKKTRTYNVSIDDKELKRAHKEQRITFCLKSTITKENGQHDIIDTKEAQAFLNQLPRGEELITLYQYETIIEHMDTVRTIIDLKSIGERTLAESLAQEKWSTRQ